MQKPPLNLKMVLENFSGDVRLFPLPNLVLFPDGLAPLKVYERRYVKMVTDALEDDGLIATALLKPGWDDADDSYLGNPPIHDVITVGQIFRHHEQPTGKCDILLYGLFRARIVDEIPHDPYRRARVEVIGDTMRPDQSGDIAKAMKRALDMLPGRQNIIWEMRRMANQTRGVDASPGRYADAVATASDLEPNERYALLAEPDILKRFTQLVSYLEKQAYASDPPVPPGTRPELN